VTAGTLSVVIVSWNTRVLLAQCLASIEAHPPDMPYEVWVVDNASADGSAEMVRLEFPEVKLIRSQENLGFARGNNLALAQAGGEQILLLNPDTVVKEGAVTRLSQVLAAQGTAGLAGGQLLNADGSLQGSCGVFPSLWTELPLVNRSQSPVRGAVHVNGPGGPMTVQAVDWVSGACLLLKREVLETIGPLDERFWLYTEETDWCYRARAAGWEVLFVPQARVTHLGRAASRQRSVETMFCFYQSRVRFVHKHRGRRQAWLVKGVLRLKAAVWSRRPGRSPLHDAYPALSPGEVTSAYRKLAQAMALPLDHYLASDWR
jgi:GT2 family glycosyltransferase